MKIQVRYFAVFRERLGRDEELIELPAGADVAAALAHLGQLYEPVAGLQGRYRVAVNQDMVSSDAILHDGDEIALIPPVAGGSDSHPRHACIVATEPPSLDRCLSHVVGSEMGGVVTFTGVVRNHSRGQEVDRLEYEAYQEMAEKVMRGLCDQIEAEFSGCRIAVEHRVGTLVVGDIAVVIAAAAPHRAEAFAACRAMIDRLKEQVPIWKKEFTPDGSSWIGLGP